MSTRSVVNAWFASNAARRGALLILLVAAGITFYNGVFRRDGDFEWHRQVGQRFLNGDPFHQTGHWYPLARTAMDGVVVLLPYRASRAVCFVLAIGALAATYRIWRQLADDGRQAPPGLDAAAGIASLLLLSPFVVRDLDDCGLQLLLLFFLSAGAWALRRGQAVKCGLWLALAASYKSVPILCLPFLIWKRQWRAAGWMAAWVVVISLAPAAYLGWEKTMECHERWWDFAKRCATTISPTEAHPSLFEYEAPRQQNVGLAAALARYFETYPPGHPLFIDHPWFVQFGTLDPASAHRVMRWCTIALAAALAWRFLRSWQTNAAAPYVRSAEYAAQWAAVCGLVALVSPLSWRHHYVMLLPAAFFVIRDLATTVPRPRWRMVALAMIAAIVLLTRRGVLGKDLALVAASYKLDAYAALALIGLVLSLPRVAKPQAEDDEKRDTMARRARLAPACGTAASGRA